MFSKKLATKDTWNLVFVFTVICRGLEMKGGRHLIFGPRRSQMDDIGEVGGYDLVLSVVILLKMRNLQG